MIANEETLKELTLGDYSIEGIQWSSTGDDISILMKRPGGLGIDDTACSSTITLEFVWVEKLRINMDFGEYMGSPLIFETSFKSLSNSRWRVMFALGVAPEGEIEFECNEIRIR